MSAYRIEVEPDAPALYVVYIGTSRVSQHETREGAEKWIAKHERRVAQNPSRPETKEEA